MLSRLYGGRRIDALDALLAPPLPQAAPASMEERLAARLPTLYAGLLLDEQAATRAGTLRALRGAGRAAAAARGARARPCSPEASALYARARLELARMYWRGVDFDQAAVLAAAGRAATPRPDDVTLVLALALALRDGPEDAADMMRKAPRALAPAPTAALDALAPRPAGPYAGLAAFDAALVRQVLAPPGRASRVL